MTTVTNGLIILNKHRCLNVILHFVCSFVRSFIRLSLSHCHQHNDTRPYFCVVIYVCTLVRWESGTNDCSRPRTIYTEYNHLSRSPFPSLFHECISHACSLRLRRGVQWRQQQSVIEPWCVSFYAAYIWHSTIVTPTSSTITELYYYYRCIHVYRPYEREESRVYMISSPSLWTKANRASNIHKKKEREEKREMDEWRTRADHLFRWLLLFLVVSLLRIVGS
jgi:hypothetical protein